MGQQDGVERARSKDSAWKAATSSEVVLGGAVQSGLLASARPSVLSPMLNRGPAPSHWIQTPS